MEGRDRPLVRRSLIAFGVVGFAALFAALAFATVIVKRAMTPAAMTETSVRIQLYFQRNKKLPANLSVLPVRKDYANRTTDAWDRPLIYVINGDDEFTLGSLGRDGIPGGTGRDADLTRKYRVVKQEVREVPAN